MLSMLTGDRRVALEEIFEFILKEQSDEKVSLGVVQTESILTWHNQSLPRSREVGRSQSSEKLAAMEKAHY